MAKNIRREPSIASAYGVTGEVDSFKDMAEYQDTCDRLFDDDKNTERYTTHFISETYLSKYGCFL